MKGLMIHGVYEMPSVTVDLEDLETIVFTTGALKTIEGALQQRKNDPFVKPHLEFTAAHDRLASAMRNARRSEAGTLVPWDGELSTDELDFLRDVDAGDVDRILLETKISFDSLAAKGCIDFGQPLTGVLWAGEKTPTWMIDALGDYCVRITVRGRAKLAKIDAANAKKVTDLCGND